MIQRCFQDTTDLRIHSNPIINRVVYPGALIYWKKRGRGVWPQPLPTDWHSTVYVQTHEPERKPDNHIDTLTHHKPHWHRHRRPGWRMSVIVSPTAQQQTKLTGNENGSITLRISVSALCNYALRGAGLHLPTHTHAASWDINWKYGGAKFTGEVGMIHLPRWCLHKFYSSTACVFYAPLKTWRRLLSWQQKLPSVVFLNVSVYMCFCNYTVSIDFKSKQWFAVCMLLSNPHPEEDLLF